MAYKEEMIAVRPGDLTGDATALADTLLLAKSPGWKYESEYRVLARVGGTVPSFGTTTTGDYLTLVENSLIGVVAGANANISAIRSLVREYGGGIRLKVAVRRPHEYHLDIVDDVAA